MTKQNLKIRRNLWEAPWGYVESFLVGIGLMLTGFFIEITQQKAASIAITYPYNLAVIIGFVIFLVLLHLFFKNTKIIRWLTKVPASISSIVLLTILVMVMGIIPQTTSENSVITNLGLNKITRNWAFLLVLGYFLTCLGLVTIKRISQFKWSNIGFILNHLGLFIALTAGMLGTGDLQRLTITTFEGKHSWIANDTKGNKVELPFAFYLNDFKIEEYAPKLALVNNTTGKVVENKGKNLFLIKKDHTYSYNIFEVTIDKFLKSSGKIGNKYALVNELGAPPSAYISVKNIKNDSIKSGWISCGSFSHPYKSLKLNATYSMVMTISEAKKFSSDIAIVSKEGKKTNTILEVNKPYSYRGWKIYQLSYDERLGKWSNTSIIELVKDPWLPAIYIGIFMMIAGAFYLFWIGNKKTKES